MPATQADGEADQEAFVKALKKLGALLASELEANFDDNHRPAGLAQPADCASGRPLVG
jgi:hypothetical protein